MRSGAGQLPNGQHHGHGHHRRKDALRDAVDRRGRQNRQAHALAADAHQVRVLLRVQNKNQAHHPDGVGQRAGNGRRPHRERALSRKMRDAAKDVVGHRPDEDAGQDRDHRVQEQGREHRSPHRRAVEAEQPEDQPDDKAHDRPLQHRADDDRHVQDRRVEGADGDDAQRGQAQHHGHGREHARHDQLARLFACLLHGFHSIFPPFKFRLLGYLTTFRREARGGARMGSARIDSPQGRRGAHVYFNPRKAVLQH